MRKWFAFVLFLFAGLSAAPLHAAEAPQRAAARAMRAKIATGFVEAKRRELGSTLSSMNAAVKWLAGLQAKSEAEELLAAMRAIHPDSHSVKDAESAVAAISTPQPFPEEKRAEWNVKKRNLVQLRSQGLLRLANVCYGAGLMGYAYDLVLEILDEDPQNPVARAALGHVKVGDAWQTKYAAAQLQKGFVYVPELGWAPKAMLSKIEGGEWPDGAQLVPLKSADARHANLTAPWEIETENFIVRSTASRRQAIQIAERVEGIRAFVYRQYLDFFQHANAGRGSQMLFNQAPAKKMVIYYLANKKDYDATIDRDMNGRNTDLLKRSAGFYSGSTGASYFHYRADYGTFLFKLMQHEVTHQILGEFARGGQPPTWLTEGLAEVLEYAEVDANGRYSLPRGRAHPDVENCAKFLARGQLGTLTSLLNLPREQFHAEPGRARNYQFAGAVCRFFIEHENGLIAADFLQFAAEQYRGGKARDLFDFIGADPVGWDAAFRKYLSGQ